MIITTLTLTAEEAMALARELDKHASSCNSNGMLVTFAGADTLPSVYSKSKDGYVPSVQYSRAPGQKPESPAGGIPLFPK
jgi:hypothetical protein